jgi:molybdopterin converting factor small subunit
MSKVKVKYYGLVRNIVNREEEETYLSGGATVEELLHTLVQRYGDRFRSMILTPEWQLLDIAMIHINDRDISDIDGLNTKLPDDSELTITVTVYEIVGG